MLDFIFVILVLFLAFMVFIIIFGIIDDKKNPSDVKWVKGFYVGGLPNVLDRIPTRAYLQKVRISLLIDKITVEIPYENVISVTGKSEEQIRDEIKLGRLILFGVFALGMKKQTISNRKFIVIEYNDGNTGNVNTIVIESLETEKFIEYYNDKKQKFEATINTNVNENVNEITV